MKRIKEDNPKRFAIPIVLTESRYVPTSLANFAERNIYKDGYLSVLRNLIIFAYGFDEDTFDEKTGFNELVEALKKETSQGYSNYQYHRN